MFRLGGIGNPGYHHLLFVKSQMIKNTLHIESLFPSIVFSIKSSRFVCFLFCFEDCCLHKTDLFSLKLGYSHTTHHRSGATGATVGEQHISEENTEQEPKTMRWLFSRNTEGHEGQRTPDTRETAKNHTESAGVRQSPEYTDTGCTGPREEKSPRLTCPRGKSVEMFHTESKKWFSLHSEEHF